uniref:F-box domain-containing protein n=1 Tax=Anopheles epiroticus TaxID=199890 RepID=A0A182PFX4_9DIPT
MLPYCGRNPRQFVPPALNRVLSSMEQYVQSVLHDSYAYGPETKCNSFNVIGRPHNYTAYRDDLHTYMLNPHNSYGRWERTAPSYMPEFGLANFSAEDYPPVDELLVVSYERAVYPTSIAVYESHYTSAIVRIWAFTTSKLWHLLWDRSSDGNVQRLGNDRGNIFWPTIRPLQQLTCVLALEFNVRDLTDAYGIDGIMLVGEFDPSKGGDRVVLPIGWGNLVEDPSPQLVPTKQPAPIVSGATTIMDLPYEMLIHIFSFLDLPSLRNVSRVSDVFDGIASDSRLYRQVNMQPCWMQFDRHWLEWLTERCTNIRKLDLSWCGLFGMFHERDLDRLLQRNGQTLTHLRLNAIGCASTLLMLLKRCTSLVELCVRSTMIICPSSFDTLQGVTHLQKLDLANTRVTTFLLVEILKQSPNLLHLNVASCAQLNAGAIATILRKHNRKLVSLIMWKMCIHHTDELLELRGCSQLQELNLGYLECYGATYHSVGEILADMPDMRRLVVPVYPLLYSDDLRAIARCCPLLEYLDSSSCSMVSSEGIQEVLASCKALRFLDISFCDVSRHQIDGWVADYPLVELHAAS